MNQLIRLGLAGLLLCCGLPAALGADVLAIKADRIETIAAGTIENGVILIEEGRIREIGPRAKVTVPDSAQWIDASSQTVFPGLINPFSRLGLSSSPGGSAASHPQYRVRDEWYPYQDLYHRVAEAGFTTLGLVPAGAGISGQGMVVAFEGLPGKELILKESGMLIIDFQAGSESKNLLKRAFEEAAQKSGIRLKTTSVPPPTGARSGPPAERPESSPAPTGSSAGATDPQIAPLADALRGDLPTFIRCASPADLRHLILLLEPFDQLKPVIVPGPEIELVAQTLAEKKLPVVLPAQTMFQRFTRNRINPPAILAKAGVKIACVPAGDSVAGHETFLLQLAQLVKAGLDRTTALKAVTLHPAEMLGLDHRLGTLEAGKDATLLILSGDPLATATRIERILVRGKTIYQRGQ